jgi:hypothetical protein
MLSIGRWVTGVFFVNLEHRKNSRSAHFGFQPVSAEQAYESVRSSSQST